MPPRQYQISCLMEPREGFVDIFVYNLLMFTYILFIAVNNPNNSVFFCVFVQSEGLSVYNKIYSFDADFRGTRTTMVMTSVSGHLLSLDFVSSYMNWNSCDPISLFSAPVYKLCQEKSLKIKKTLEREV